MAVPRAAGLEHRHELAPVADRGDEPRAAHLDVRARVVVGEAEVAPDLGVDARAVVRGVVREGVDAGKAAALLRRDREAGVVHAERPEDLVAQPLAVALAGRDLDERADDVRVHPVGPLVAGVERERDAADAVRELDRPGGVVARVDLGGELLHLGVEAAVAGIPVAGVADAARHVEQVEDVDRARADGAQLLAVPPELVLEAGQVFADRRARREEAAVHAHRGGKAGHALRGREHPEERVARHRASGLDVGHAGGGVPDFAGVLDDGGLDAGALAAVDGAPHHVGEDGKA